MLAVVRLNSDRLLAGRTCGRIDIFLGDTRPSKGFQIVWQVFWLTVIGIDVLAFPGVIPSGIQ